MIYEEILPDGTIRVRGLLIDFDYAIKMDELGRTTGPGDRTVSLVDYSYILDLTAHNRVHFHSWLPNSSALPTICRFSTPL